MHNSTLVLVPGALPCPRLPATRCHATVLEVERVQLVGGDDQAVPAGHGDELRRWALLAEQVAQAD